MGLSESEALLDLAKDLHGEVDRYLSDTASFSYAIPRIVDMCKEMRTKKLGEAANYWLCTLERHATEIVSSRSRPGIEGYLLIASVCLGTELLRDSYFMRTRLDGEIEHLDGCSITPSDGTSMEPAWVQRSLW